MIRMKKQHYEKILAHAVRELGNEACGLIAGKEENGDRIVREVYLLTNTDHSPEHFSMDPKEQLAAIRDMRQKGDLPLGNWHSHPESPSRPSEEDKRLAYDKKSSYLILSLMDREHPVLRSFHIEGDAVTEEELYIEDEQIQEGAYRYGD